MRHQIWHLRNCDLFDKLTPEEISHVESRCLAKPLSRNTPVYLPSDFSNGVFMLAKGRVKICHLTPEGKQSILGFINPGELFGELSLFQEGSRDEYAEAVEKSLIVLIPEEVMKSMVERHPSVSVGITKLIGLRRMRIERRLKHLLFQSNKERLVHLLLDLVEQYGKESDNGIALSINLSHQDMASLIGSTRESVTLLLGELQNQKLIKTARRKVWITNLNELSGIVSIAPPKVGSTLAPAVPEPMGLDLAGKKELLL